MDIEKLFDYLKAFWTDDCDTVVHWSPLPDLRQDSERMAKKKEDDGIVFVAEYETKIVGTIEAGVSKADELRHTCGFGMAVLPECRRRGIGRGLLQHLLTWAEERCLLIVELDVFSINIPAIRLYSNLGFTEDGRIKNGVKLRSGTFCDLIHMSKYVGAAK